VITGPTGRVLNLPGVREAIAYNVRSKQLGF
jgi:hypothetical protein